MLDNAHYFFIMTENSCITYYNITNKVLKENNNFKRAALSQPYIKILEYN